MILFGGLRVASRFVFLKTLRSHDALAPVISCIPSLEQITTYSPPPPSYDPNTNKTPAGQAFTGDRTLLFVCLFMHDVGPMHCYQITFI